MSGFIERLAARRGPISYTAPAPSPDGLRLAWISDVDGRPRAWLADLEPSGSVKEPDQPLCHVGRGEEPTAALVDRIIDPLVGHPALRKARTK